MGIISKKDEEFLENVEYFSEIIDRINDIQTDNNYSDEEMNNDLDVALWRAFVYINLWSYKGYAKAEKILKKVENKGIKNPIWCYRYGVSIARLRKYKEALKYFILGTEVDSTYPWNWLLYLSSGGSFDQGNPNFSINYKYAVRCGRIQ